MRFRPSCRQLDARGIHAGERSTGQYAESDHASSTHAWKCQRARCKRRYQCADGRKTSSTQAVTEEERRAGDGAKYESELDAEREPRLLTGGNRKLPGHTLGDNRGSEPRSHAERSEE